MSLTDRYKQIRGGNCPGLELITIICDQVSYKVREKVQLETGRHIDDRLYEVRLQVRMINPKNYRPTIR